MQIKDTDTGHKVLFVGYRIQCTMHWVQDTGYKLRIKIQDTKYCFQDAGYRIENNKNNCTGYRIQGTFFQNTG